MTEFGDRLRPLRRRCRESDGTPLTQERLGELLGDAVGDAGGYSGAAISAWELGKSKPAADQRAVLLGLLRVLRERGDVRAPEAEALLRAGNYRSLDAAEREQLFGPAPVRRELPADSGWPPELPVERYRVLPGRERTLDRLAEALREAAGPASVAVDGLGGLGKTALALEAARRAVAGGQFARVVGTSARPAALFGDEIVPLRQASLDGAELRQTLCRQLGLAPDDTARLPAALRETPCLLVVDNLESAANAAALVADLTGLLAGGPSRLLVTSRRKLPYDLALGHTLTPLSLDDTRNFLAAEARLRGLDHLTQAGAPFAQRVQAVTGGAPLALKLFVALAGALDVGPVLAHLERAGTRLYTFIFRQSWQQLSPAARGVLVYCGRQAVGPVSWSVLAQAEAAPSADDLVEALDQLVGLSLLDQQRAGAGWCYQLHPLTRNFVNSDLPETWGRR